MPLRPARFPTPAQLDQARREWLAGLQREHAALASAGTALALAQGEWRCGEYEPALAHFAEARDRAPDDPETHVALLRAASMLDHGELESEALAAALALHPASPAILFHAALRDVPADLARARARLSQLRELPLCREYDDAVATIAGDPPQDAAPADADPARQARAQSLRWALRHGRDAAVHVGRPCDVLARALAAAPDAGLTLECGVYFGRSLRIIAERSPGRVHGFDSFQGLPEAWNANEGAGAYSTGGRMPQVAANVELHAGWFEQTLPAFFAAHAGPVRLLHVDCDLYSSTCTVLAAAGPRLVPGSVLVFDDMLGYPGFEQHELRAFEEHVRRTGLRWELVAACLLGREVAIRVTSD